MSFRTIFTKSPGKDSKFFGETWTRETPGPTPEFLAAYEAIESPAVKYCVVNGHNQYLIDGFANCKTEAEFHAKVDKNYANVMSGNVRSATAAVVVKKTPLETEILRLAGDKIDEFIEKKSKEAGFVRPTVANRLALVEMIANDQYEDFAREAKQNLAKKNGIASNPELKAMMAALLAPLAEPKSGKGK